jgi:hypothetical protein
MLQNGLTAQNKIAQKVIFFIWLSFKNARLLKKSPKIFSIILTSGCLASCTLKNESES